MKSSPRTRSVHNWALALLIMVAGSLVLGSCGSEAGSVETAQQTETDSYRALVPKTPLEKPAFTLPDTSGSPFDFAKETEGYVTLLYFGYTHCPDICPLHMARLARTLEELPEDVSSRVKVVFVATDPYRDTPERLREWLDYFDPEIVGLVPQNQEAANDISKRTLGAFWAPITNENLPGGGYAVQHPAVVIAYTTDNLAHLLYPFGIKREAWEHDLPKLVKEGWEER